MKRKVFAIGMTLLCAAMFAVPTVTVAAEGDDGEADQMNQGQLALLLVEKLGLLSFLPPNPSAMECMMILSQNGIFPSPTLGPTEQNPTPGWSLDPSTKVTMADLAVVLVRALGLEETVQGDKADPQNWMNALQSVNVPTDTVEGGVQTLIPLSAALQNISAGSTSGNPLSSVFIPSSSGSGLLNGLTFPDVESSLNELQDEGRPIPLTPT
ncbi:MAG: hypothetical protein FJ221_07025 [Lentisphaerae bacterium]|nr:hypothetical protein [Lentisphaerota bacterium]